MTIEKAEVKDTEELLEIYAPYVRNTAVSFEYAVPSAEEFSSRIRTISGKYPYIKAVDDSGRILGYAYAHEFSVRSAYDWSVETTVYVAQGERRRGTGRVLYEALERSLQDMGILNMNACIAMPQCDPDPHLTEDSYRFHSRMGFETVGRFHGSGSKFGRWYDMIWMEKMIGAHTDDPASVRFGDWKLFR